MKRIVNAAIGLGEYGVYVASLKGLSYLYDGDIPFWYFLALIPLGAFTTCDSPCRIIFNESMRTACKHGFQEDKSQEIYAPSLPEEFQEDKSQELYSPPLPEGFQEDKSQELYGPSLPEGFKFPENPELYGPPLPEGFKFPENPELYGPPLPPGFEFPDSSLPPSLEIPDPPQEYKSVS